MVVVVRADKVMNTVEAIKNDFNAEEISEIINALILDKKVQEDIHQDFIGKVRLVGLYNWVKNTKIKYF
ncbi:MAG: hypothetical protein NTU58_03390 [Candidatus Nealsonbacteria bacterium]|nr:hypothetical protein [Candidatus Nealsonbacteria bacterium]